MVSDRSDCNMVKQRASSLPCGEIGNEKGGDSNLNNVDKKDSATVLYTHTHKKRKTTTDATQTNGN